jgi:hypothetical protein
MSIVLQSSGGGSLTIQEPTTASNFTQTLSSATGTVALLQTPSFATTIGVGGATPSTSGAGITFPATQSTSSDANTLDDYEEGDYTPTILEGITSVSYSTQTGRYTKIGNLVYVAVRLIISGGTTSSGVLVISLPFTNASTTNLFPTGTVYSNSCSSNAQNLTVIARPAYTQVECYVQASTGLTGFTGSNFGTSGDISFTIAYRV